MHLALMVMSLMDGTWIMVHITIQPHPDLSVAGCRVEHPGITWIRQQEEW